MQLNFTNTILKDVNGLFKNNDAIEKLSNYGNNRKN